MPAKVFFSWQSDTLDINGKQFIEDALKQAIQALSKSQKVDEDIEVDEPNRQHSDEEVIEEQVEDAIDEEIEFDKDTKDDTGSPPIFERVRDKIDNCALIVSDLTCIAERKNRQIIPNPNVLIEYGYAYKKLTWRRIVQVMNIAFGAPTLASMPFDMALHRLPIQYNLPDNATEKERAKELKKLSNTLKRAISNVLTSPEYRESRPKPPAPPPVKYREPLDGHSRFRHKSEPLGLESPSYSAILETPSLPIFMAHGAAVWFRLAPQFPLGKQFKISELKDYFLELVRFPIFGSTGNSKIIRGPDGIGCCHGTDGQTTTIVSYLFTDGEIWTVDGFSLQLMPDLISIDRRRLEMSLKMSAVLLNKLSIPFPFRMVIGIEGIGLRRLAFDDQFPRKSEPCALDPIEKEGIVRTESDISELFQDFLDELYEQCGLKPALLQDNP